MINDINYFIGQPSFLPWLCLCSHLVCLWSVVLSSRLWTTLPCLVSSLLCPTKTFTQPSTRMTSSLLPPSSLLQDFSHSISISVSIPSCAISSLLCGTKTFTQPGTSSPSPLSFSHSLTSSLSLSLSLFLPRCACTTINLPVLASCV